MKWLNFDQCHLIRACGLQGPGEVKDRPEAVREAAELAVTVMGAAHRLAKAARIPVPSASPRDLVRDIY